MQEREGRGGIGLVAAGNSGLGRLIRQLSFLERPVYVTRYLAQGLGLPGTLISSYLHEYVRTARVNYESR